MKNKRAIQEEDRKKHKEQLRASRRQEPNLGREVPTISTNPEILIVCEGKNTEPSYFNKFKLSSATVKAIGRGENTISLVNSAKKLAEEKKYAQVWCVFDKDDFSDNDFNNAIHLADSLGFKVAYSNQSFEYWLILHFDDHQGGCMHRTLYNQRLETLLKPYNVVYDGDGSKIVTDELFDLLFAIVETKKGTKRVDLAALRAERNCQFFEENNPAKEESSTKVYLLVNELLKYI